MKKLDKKGFTLVELLAVIAILAILLLLVTPNVLKMFTQGKKDTFVIQAQTIWKAAGEQYIADAIHQPDHTAYCNGEVGSSGLTELSLSGDENLKYFVELNSNGEVIKLVVSDKSYHFEHTSGVLSLNEIKADAIEDGEISIDCAARLSN